MSYVQHQCPSCGAPLPPPPPTGSHRCGYCDVLLATAPGGWRPAAPPPVDEALVHPEALRLWVGGARYALLGRIAQGEGADVFLGRRDGRLTELVVIKVLRAPGDGDLLAREHEVLTALEASRAQGAPHFTRLLPQRVALGTARLGMRGELGERRVAVHRWRSGFVHTFDDVAREHPLGITAGHAVWMWKRVLELLGWIHASGWVHGAVLPPHLLVHARDHGVTLIGYSRAVPAGRPLPAFSDDHRGLYPAAVWGGGPATPATDVTMSARCLARVLAGVLGTGGGDVPGPLRALIDAHAGEAPPIADAWALRDRLDEVARGVLGSPRFVPFTLSGWVG